MKPNKIRVMPARPGMNLCHPISGPLPDHGRSWIDDSFTRRRVADGGVVIVQETDPPPEVDRGDADPAALPGDL